MFIDYFDPWEIVDAYAHYPEGILREYRDKIPEIHAALRKRIADLKGHPSARPYEIMDRAFKNLVPTRAASSPDQPDGPAQ